MSRVVRLLGRTKAYFIECKQSIAPMPNPDWYEEKKDTLVNFRNLRKLPLSVHAEVWKTAWEWYKSSFEDSFAWGKRRKEEAKKNEAQAKMDVLQGMVKDAREATHNSPEDLDKTKQALKELLQEIHENQDEIKSVAQEKLDLIRVSLSAFSSGYREARDEEIKRVMAMDKSMLQSFLNERAGEVKHASSLISDALLEDKAQGTSAKNASKPTTVGAAAASEAAAEKGDGAPEPDDGVSDPRAFLSKRARGVVDDFLHDPDIEALTGRAAGFARGRLFQAEAAAKVWKGEEDGAGGSSTRDPEALAARREGEKGGALLESGDAHARDSVGGGDSGGSVSGSSSVSGRDSGGGTSETPIISGLASEAREFVAGKVGQAHDGVKEVVEAAIDVRRSYQAVEEEEDVGREGEAAGGKGRAGDKVRAAAGREGQETADRASKIDGEKTKGESR